VLFCDLGQLDEIFLGAPPGGACALLIELAQVIQVIDVEANALGVGGFAAWGKPDVVDANSL
jgi:hypothetical protein